MLQSLKTNFMKICVRLRDYYGSRNRKMVWSMFLPHTFRVDSKFSYLLANKSHCGICRNKIAE